MSTLLPVFERCLADAPATASYDALRHSVVILMGTLAKHLDADNPKVRPIVGLLIETLSTPSQQVCIHSGQVVHTVSCAGFIVCLRNP